MKSATLWHFGMASDAGLERAVNEDRVWADGELGAFLVVDGVGGHAAGELAAETAVQTIAEEIRASTAERTCDAEETIRRAITRANNEIFSLAATKPEYEGMACVLTLAMIRDERVTVGHVGDSRLYLAWNGNLRKITSDHSPVGEREDEGELTEREAMFHPRRNEIFRDVGTKPRQEHDAQFIEIKAFPFRPDAALLLCSDGLTDLVSSSEIREIIERHDGDAGATARELVAAANASGGTDNVSAIFVAGPEFLGSESASLAESRARHAITRFREHRAGWRKWQMAAIWFLVGAVLGAAAWAGAERVVPRFVALPAQHSAQVPH
jgi:serine/threonine protein phosphatase PrpC